MISDFSTRPEILPKKEWNRRAKKIKNLLVPIARKTDQYTEQYTEQRTNYTLLVEFIYY